MEEMQDSLFLSNHIKKNMLFLFAVIRTTKTIQTTTSLYGKEVVLTISKSIINNNYDSPYEHCSLRCETEFEPHLFLNEELGITVCDHPIIHFIKQREEEKKKPDVEDYFDMSGIEDDDLEEYFFIKKTKAREQKRGHHSGRKEANDMKK
ncbi:hypothetical protein AKO1_002553 [Acrasis kona]|uniref:Uncharacterized protein n=1 Tax=Acrasis kona TaxID=1008807 RepID=A0AAW2ZP61_9EUKA